MNSSTKQDAAPLRIAKSAASPFVRSRAPRTSWLTLVGSISLHAAVFAIAAQFVTGTGGGEAQPAADDGGEELSLSVTIASPMQPRSATANPNVIRKALPAQQQRVMAAAHTDFALPPPVPELDLPEPRPLEKKTTRPSETDLPPSKKVASRSGKRGGGTTAKGQAGSGLGSGNATAPKPIATRVPVYPYSARKRGEQGMVLVRVRVNDAGRVESSTLYRSSGHADLDEAAVACVWKWNFAPGESGGRAVGSSAVVRVSFRIEG